MQIIFYKDVINIKYFYDRDYLVVFSGTESYEIGINERNYEIMVNNFMIMIDKYKTHTVGKFTKSVQK